MNERITKKKEIRMKREKAQKLWSQMAQYP